MSIFEKYFDSIPERFKPLFEGAAMPWDPLGGLEDFLRRNLREGNKGEARGDVLIGDDVEIGEGTIIEHGAVVFGPTIIGRNCEVRAGAYVRGNVVVGDGCVVGHATEVIRSILFSRVRVDHFNYVGDSILGNGAHFGAGAKVANLRFDGKEIFVGDNATGRKKFGVIIGDDVQLGVNAIVGPGALLERGTWFVGPGPLQSGFYNKDSFRKK